MRRLKEPIMNYSPEVLSEIKHMKEKDQRGDCSPESTPIKSWEKQFCLKNSNPCYGAKGARPGFPTSDIGGSTCVSPYSSQCQSQSTTTIPNKSKETKEDFLDWSLYNPPISNGFIPDWWNNLGYLPQGANYAYSGLAYKNALDRIYNPLRYPYRSQAFYEQGWYPNMIMPPQVIGCGGRRQGCLGGTQEGIPTIPPPIEISERNIAPVNIMTRGPQGIPQQVGVLYKIFGSLNEIYPLYGRKRYPNSDTWDYYTVIGEQGNQVKVPVLTKKKNHNELGSNEVVSIAGNSAKFRTTIYDSDFPQYIPYA